MGSSVVSEATGENEEREREALSIESEEAN